jgi:hypothetical protein
MDCHLNIMRALVALVISLAISELHAKDVEIQIRPAEGAKHGVTVELSTLNPGVIQAVVHFVHMPKEVGLVLNDSRGKFVTSVAVLPRDHTCVAILQEDYVEHSYFVFPYVAKPDEQVYQVFLRDRR